MSSKSISISSSHSINHERTDSSSTNDSNGSSQKNLTATKTYNFLSGVNLNCVSIEQLPDPPTPTQDIIQAPNIRKLLKANKLRRRSSPHFPIHHNHHQDKNDTVKKHEASNLLALRDVTNDKQMSSNNNIANTKKRRQSLSIHPSSSFSRKLDISDDDKVNSHDDNNDDDDDDDDETLDFSKLLQNGLIPPRDNAAANAAAAKLIPKNETPCKENEDKKNTTTSTTTTNSRIKRNILPPTNHAPKSKMPRTNIESSSSQKSQLHPSKPNSSKQNSRNLNDTNKVLLQHIRNYCAIPLSQREQDSKQHPLAQAITQTTNYPFPPNPIKSFSATPSNSTKNSTQQSKQEAFHLNMEQKRNLLQKIAPMVQQMEQRRKYETTFVEKHTQCKVLSRKSGRYEFLHIPTQTIIPSQKYQQIYLAHIDKHKQKNLSLHMSKQPNSKVLATSVSTSAIISNDSQKNMKTMTVQSKQTRKVDDSNVIAKSIQSLFQENDKKKNDSPSLHSTASSSISRSSSKKGRSSSSKPSTATNSISSSSKSTQIMKHSSLTIDSTRHRNDHKINCNDYVGKDDYDEDDALNDMSISLDMSVDSDTEQKDNADNHNDEFQKHNLKSNSTRLLSNKRAFSSTSEGLTVAESKRNDYIDNNIDKKQVEKNDPLMLAAKKKLHQRMDHALALYSKEILEIRELRKKQRQQCQQKA